MYIDMIMIMQSSGMIIMYHEYKSNIIITIATFITFV